jgi:hypothetical protein
MVARMAYSVIGIVAVAIVSVLLLVPLLTSPTTSKTSVLLDETVIFGDDFYENDFYLQLSKGEKISVNVDGNGQPIDFKIADHNGMTVNNVDLIDVYSYAVQLVAPEEGTYRFHVASAGNPTVHLVITKL